MTALLLVTAITGYLAIGVVTMRLVDRYATSHREPLRANDDVNDVVLGTAVLMWPLVWAYGAGVGLLIGLGRVSTRRGEKQL